MAWEERRRGRRYYYRKRWQNGRCVSEYIGGGEYGALLAGFDEAERSERRRERALRRREEESDAGLDALTEMASTLATAALLIAGCHTHKGQWRRCRDQYES